MGIQSYLVSESTASGPKGIPSDMAWSEPRYCSFSWAAKPPRCELTYVVIEYKTLEECSRIDWLRVVGFIPAVNGEDFASNLP